MYGTARFGRRAAGGHVGRSPPGGVSVWAHQTNRPRSRRRVPASDPPDQVTAASGRRVRMTTAEVGFSSPDELAPKRRSAVSLVLATPERRRRAAVLAEVRHLSRKERAAIGKEARGSVPRSRHAELYLGADRPDPIALLQEQARTRIPELVPIRYGRMLESEFAFFRGAALIMASDLSRTPVTGHPRPAVRRRAPVELRPVRVARAPRGVRHQRFRRDAARSVGVGPQAPGRQLRDRRSRQRPARPDAPPDRRACRRGVPRGDGHVRDPHEPDRLVRAARRRAVHRGRAHACPAAPARSRDRARGAVDRQGAHPRLHARLRQAHRDRRRPAADRAGPAPGGAVRGPGPAGR